MLSREPSLALLGIPQSSHLIAHDGAGSPARQLGPVTGEQHIRPPLLVPPSRRHHSQAGTALSGAASAQTFGASRENRGGSLPLHLLRPLPQ